MDVVEKRYLTWDQVDGLVDELATQVKSEFTNIDSIYGIPRGGLIPAVMLSHKLGIPYSDKITLKSLIVDDICDSGVTLKAWEGYTTAVLLYKPHTSCAVPTIYGSVHSSDAWIIYPWERDDSKTIQDYKLDI
jgi:hypoxanthine phosphoribosyltransferase